ncbi:tRNA (adenosine(37)-N6)-dimethylallyltransferase MiaA [Desulfotomaculum copahuensis]|uniref:tRNA (adenosine(37)-N6)-dimethylallyltransferase MiaA n=1 Tax=Desulfotomaculum copahuensis TaxID=1838280 RepID=UPI000A8D293F|nr:tRNA (adenosine(37)-N6)-dimethylallyltransferase MiaA [Desulfotomaculum copahuensis]
MTEISIPLLVIAGPTATGKTALAVALAGQLNGEVVSADSMLVYRGMDIGTAKPSMAERRGIPHHLIDVVDPDQDYNVALYQRQARDCIEDIHRRGKLPLLAGGTGLYIRAVIDHFTFTPAGVDPAFRRQMQELAVREGPSAVHRLLAAVDAGAAVRIHPNNLKRVIRALEVHHLTGRSMSAFRDRNEGKNDYRPVMFGLAMERAALYRRVEARVEEMLGAGLIEEVKGLLNRGYGPQLPAMQGLGYKEIAAFLRGECSREEAVELLKKNTRRFAKRQYTWFRADKRITWLDVEAYSGPAAMAQEINQRLAGVWPGASKK